MQKILRNILHCYPHKITDVQEFFSDGLSVRGTFDLEFLARMDVNYELPWTICGQTKPISISKILSIYKIAEYVQRIIHSYMHQYRFNLQM